MTAFACDHTNSIMPHWQASDLFSVTIANGGMFGVVRSVLIKDPNGSIDWATDGQHQLGNENSPGDEAFVGDGGKLLLMPLGGPGGAETGDNGTVNSGVWGTFE